MRNLRISNVAAGLLSAWLPATVGLAQVSAQGEPVLGPAPRAPFNVAGLPGKGPRKLEATAGFSVNSNSREQVREFYNAVYAASEGVPINSSALTASCDAGTNSTAFLSATLWRINWFRAMCGIPADVTFSASEEAADQSAALMMSANNQLLHVGIPPTWSCFSSSGTNAAANSNLASGANGPDAITSFVWDYGTANSETGHRRWILYPQTQVMASGDVPAQSPYSAANATWILDANFGGPRPATVEPYVAWPPPGYAPYPVVFPQWSFALSNADFSAATVTMQSNGVPLGVVVQPYVVGYGEDTLVWYPSGLDPTSQNTLFPFSGADTVYAIKINNVLTIAGVQSFNYSVTVFDPALPGSDYVPTLVLGTNRPSVNENNPYTCTPSANPSTTGYQWMVAQSTNGNLSDKALKGLTNFTISPPPIYSVITNPPVGSGSCFHLTHTNPVPQLLQFKEILFPATNTSLSFQSLLGYASSNEVARVQVSTNNGVAWVDLFAQPGTNGPGQKAFVAHTLPLSNYAGQITLVRFDYDYTGGAYYPEISNYVGWCFENILLTNASQLVNFSTNATASPSLNLVPAHASNWVLEVCPVLFGQFPLAWSAATQVSAVTNVAPTLLSLGSPAFANGQAQLPFAVTQGAASAFNLIQAAKVTGPWTTNSAAVLSTLVPGSSFQFAAPAAASATFYRVLTP